MSSIQNFKINILHHQFSNLKLAIEEPKRCHYILEDDAGNELAAIVLKLIRNCDNSLQTLLMVEIDNMPKPKIYYSSNFPISTPDEFSKELKSIGLNLTK